MIPWVLIQIVVSLLALALSCWSLWRLRRIQRHRPPADPRVQAALMLLDQPWPQGDDRWDAVVKEALGILKQPFGDRRGAAQSEAR